MEKFWNFILDFLAQFAGGRGGVENELVRFGLASILWAILLLVVWVRRRNQGMLRESALIWGFGLGLARELLMLLVYSLQIMGVGDAHTLHFLYPPLEHSLALAAIVIVAGAFMRYLLDDPSPADRYIRWGVATVAFCYFITFLWWARHILENPTSSFGLVWCDWVFHGVACVVISMPIFLLLRKTGWLRNILLAALLFHFLDDFLMLFNLATDEKYRTVFGPIRHSSHLLGIFMLGYIYWREQIIERQRLEKDILEISDREQRSIGQNLHDALVQHLASIAFLSKLMANKLKSENLPQSRDAMEITRLLQEAIDHARGISRGLYPIQIVQEGLMAALEELASSTTQIYQVPCYFNYDQSVSITDMEVATHVYRIVQEAVNNAVKHGNPKEIIIDLGGDNGRIMIKVKGNRADAQSGGKEMPKRTRRSKRKGMGMRIMQYRASMINADLEFEYNLQSGSVVSCSFPNLQSENDNLEASKGPV